MTGGTRGNDRGQGGIMHKGDEIGLCVDTQYHDYNIHCTTSVFYLSMTRQRDTKTVYVTVEPRLSGRREI